MATLRLIPASGSPIDVDTDVAVVGRDAASDVVVNDGTVSRRHARLERRGGAWVVVDESSANGTFLNGHRISESALRSGQELRFGGVSYRLDIEDTSATILMSAPTSTDATILSAPIPRMPPPSAPRPPAPRAVTPAPPPAAPVRPPRPPAAPPPSAAPAPPAVPAPPPRAHVEEPAPKGRGAGFWAALGCGGLVVAAVAAGAIAGRGYFASRGASPAPAPSAAPSVAAARGALVVETTSVQKTRKGQGVTVLIKVRVAGFELRPEGAAYRLDLVEDLETIGPDGVRIPDLSRPGLKTLNTVSERGVAATFDTTITFVRPDPGRYRAVLTIHDRVAGKAATHEVPFELP
jgi:pSer/pThr/pTyr-binding forkhead associated (FHA) protein